MSRAQRLACERPSLCRNPLVSSLASNGDTALGWSFCSGRSTLRPRRQHPPLGRWAPDFKKTALVRRRQRLPAVASSDFCANGSGRPGRCGRLARSHASRRAMPAESYRVRASADYLNGEGWNQGAVLRLRQGQPPQPVTFSLSDASPAVSRAPSLAARPACAPHVPSTSRPRVAERC